jgi:hypothetical protein
MAQPARAVGEPIALRGNSIYFTSWKYVRQGSFAWIGANSPGGGAAPLGIWESDGAAPARFVPRDIPYGVRLVAQQAETLLLPPGTLGPVASIVQDGGRYRAWYTTLPGEEPEPFSTRSRIPTGHNHQVRYAESDDGLHWRKPSLGLVESAGSRENNVVFRGDLQGSRRGFHGGCVFVDPSSQDERHKMFYLGLATPEEWMRFTSTYPGDADPMARRGDTGTAGRIFGVFGAVSPDGLRWHSLPEPLMIHHSDTQNTCYYDLDRGQYVAYVRTWQVDMQASGQAGLFPDSWIGVGRRSIGRAVSADFRHFSRPEIVVAPGADMAPSHLWYTNGKTALPGCPDQHVMFPWRWELERDGGDTYLFSSPDGVVWSPVPGGPVLARGAEGGPTGGYVIASVNLLALPDGDWALPFHGYPIPHKYPGRDVRTRQGLFPSVDDVVGLARWRPGRLVALESPGEGAFATVGLVPPGGRIQLNASIRPTGHLQVAIEWLGRGEVPGRGFEDADRLAGEGLALPVTWHGEASLGHEGCPIVLHFRLRHARLFGVTFV